ncbi:MAG: lipid II flippase family protein [Vulcanimicrobiaceae bacterium]
MIAAPHALPPACRALEAAVAGGGVAFWTAPLLVAVALNVVVTALQIGAYAGRVAGVRTGRIGTSISLFNFFTLASRLANLVVTPALGSLADGAAHVASCSGRIPPEFEWQLRAIMAAGLVGAVFGTMLLPLFITLFVRGVYAFERRRSMLRAVLRLFDPRVALDVVRSFRFPPPATLRALSPRGLPLQMLLGNVVVTSVYAAGVAASYFASVIDLDARTTATGLSGLVNGFGTVAFSFFVDPTTAYLTDQAVKGERPVEDVRRMVFWLAMTAILGWILSQFVLVPGALFIAAGAHVFHPGHH